MKKTRSLKHTNVSIKIYYGQSCQTLNSYNSNNETNFTKRKKAENL